MKKSIGTVARGLCVDLHTPDLGNDYITGFVRYCPQLQRCYTVRAVKSCGCRVAMADIVASGWLRIFVGLAVLRYMQ